MRRMIHSTSGHTTALLLGILLIAASLRAPFTTLPALLGPIGHAFDLNSVATGALTTLPLIAFAVISLFGARIARVFGIERALSAALIAIAIGVMWRSFGTVSSLFAGTIVVGVGIAIANVLLPSLVKRDFPMHVASLTGAYVLAMNVAAGLGSAAMLPLYGVMGWQAALASFVVLPVIAWVAWTRQGRLRARASASAAAAAGSETGQHTGGVLPGDVVDARVPGVWRSPLAWQVTLFLGFNSTINYVLIGWLPVILIDSGMAPTVAGSMQGTLLLASALPALFLGPVLRRLRDQRGVAVAASLLSVVSILGLLLAPHLALLWAVIFGIGNGAGFVLGLSFIALRSGSPVQAAALSGMVQCFGYSMAAIGPMAAGALHDVFGTWSVALLLCVAMGLIQSVIGTRAGRNRIVGGGAGA